MECGLTHQRHNAILTVFNIPILSLFSLSLSRTLTLTPRSLSISLTSPSYSQRQAVMATRVTPEVYADIQAHIASSGKDVDGDILRSLRYYDPARILTLMPKRGGGNDQNGNSNGNGGGGDGEGVGGGERGGDSDGERSNVDSDGGDMTGVMGIPPLTVGGEPARVAVLSAGTCDLPVAEEAAVTAELCGLKVGVLETVHFRLFTIQYTMVAKCSH